MTKINLFKKALSGNAPWVIKMHAKARISLKKAAIIFLSILIPGAGHVMLGRSRRGLMLVFWMLAFGFITYQLTDASISIIGRYSGGLLVQLLAVMEVVKLASMTRR